METPTLNALCSIVFAYFSFVLILDMIGAGFSVLFKKPYKSKIGELIENQTKGNPLFWFPIVIGVMYAYGLYLTLFPA